MGMYEKKGELTAQNISVEFTNINPKRLKSRRYELILEKTAPGVTGTLKITRKKLNANIYAPWIDINTGLNEINLGTTDSSGNVVPSYEMTDSDTLISDVLVEGAGITGGSVRVIFNAY